MSKDESVAQQAIKITPVILAGGKGERLRPLTSDTRPKPFLKILSQYSLFQNTVRRCHFTSAPIIVTHKNYLPAIQAHLAQINVTPRMIIVEPEHKGTAAAIALAAFALKNQGEHMLVLPSDSVMDDDGAFEKAVVRAVSEADDHIVLLGAKPTHTNPEYGYIRRLDTQSAVSPVARFVEKPDRLTARAFCRDEEYLWNTGMFVARPRVFLSELNTFAPVIHTAVQRSFYAGQESGGVYFPQQNDFEKVKSIAVDYAVMERSKNTMVCELGAAWNDAGTWCQLSRIAASKLKKIVS